MRIEAERDKMTGHSAPHLHFLIGSHGQGMSSAPVEGSTLGARGPVTRMDYRDGGRIPAGRAIA
ncbi:hypothetical protein Mro03_27610 [Microbispora rosea subsp. rosea]|nr:hypothetical protein Mro03_27610 [Microbispora rosea subsp. rosea]